MGPQNRTRDLQIIEQDAEVLVVLQLDLLADVERQVRAVHQTMRHIETLRGANSRNGPALSDTQRDVALTSLDEEIAAFEEHFSVEQQCCVDMHATIKKMRDRLAEMRRSRSSAHTRSPESSSDPGAQS